MENYEILVIEVIEFNDEDVITTSGEDTSPIQTPDY